MKYLKTLLLVFMFSLFSCKSIETINKLKTPEASEVTIGKILIVGLSANTEARNLFETRIVSLFKKKDIIAVKSLDYFKVEKDFISKSDIDNAEQDLIEKGFNTILVTKVVGTDERKTILQTILKINKNYDSFNFDNPLSYDFDKNDNSKYIMYNTKTALYCICPGKEKSLAWKTTIDLKKHKHIKKDICSFSKYLVKQMEKDSLLVR